MSHDPLCPMAGWPTMPCACDLIAAVRERTLDEARDAVIDAPVWDGVRSAKSEALAAIAALRQVTP